MAHFTQQSNVYRDYGIPALSLPLRQNSTLYPTPVTPSQPSNHEVLQRMKQLENLIINLASTVHTQSDTTLELVRKEGESCRTTTEEFFSLVKSRVNGLEGNLYGKLKSLEKRVSHIHNTIETWNLNLTVEQSNDLEDEVVAQQDNAGQQPTPISTPGHQSRAPQGESSTNKVEECNQPARRDHSALQTDLHGLDPSNDEHILSYSGVPRLQDIVSWAPASSFYADRDAVNHAPHDTQTEENSMDSMGINTPRNASPGPAYIATDSMELGDGQLQLNSDKQQAAEERPQPLSPFSLPAPQPLEVNPGLPPPALHPPSWFSKEMSPLSPLSSEFADPENKRGEDEVEDDGNAEKLLGRLENQSGTTRDLKARPSLKRQAATQALTTWPKKMVGTKKPKVQAAAALPEQTWSGKLAPVNSKPFPTFKHWPAKVKTRKYKGRWVCCDNCNYWYHSMCVGLSEDEDPIEIKGRWHCPPCQFKDEDELDTMVKNHQHAYVFCARTDCSRKHAIKSEEEYVIECLLGRRRMKGTRYYEYLVKWDGYTLVDCTWEPGSDLCKKIIDDFNDKAANEGIVRLDGTVLLKPADLLEFAEGS